MPDAFRQGAGRYRGGGRSGMAFILAGADAAGRSTHFARATRAAVAPAFPESTCFPIGPDRALHPRRRDGRRRGGCCRRDSQGQGDIEAEGGRR